MNDFKITFPLSSEDCELLLEFQLNPSLQDLASKMQRDHSIVARALKRLSEKVPVVEKKAGKWVLTETGRRINEVSRGFIVNQSAILNEQSVLKIGTNREFAARVVATDFKNLQDHFKKTTLSLRTYELGTEKAILNGELDIGLDCDRPFDPDISYSLVVDEPIFAVASRSFVKMHQKEISKGQYLHLPHLLCERLHPDKILSLSENNLNIQSRFNDIATTRAVCVQGLGWALLPAYAIKSELELGALVQMDQKSFGKSKYGVWWLRSRPYLKPHIEILIQWLRNKEL